MKKYIFILILPYFLYGETITAVVTAYCPCSICCGPNSPKPTASGRWPKEGRTAAGPKRYPFGVIIRIEGLQGTRVIEDRMSKRYPDRFDIFFNNHKDAINWGIRTCKVEIVK